MKRLYKGKIAQGHHKNEIRTVSIAPLDCCLSIILVTSSGSLVMRCSSRSLWPYEHAIWYTFHLNGFQFLQYLAGIDQTIPLCVSFRGRNASGEQIIDDVRPAAHLHGKHQQITS